MTSTSIDLKRESLLSAGATALILGIEIGFIGLLSALFGAKGVGTFFFLLAVASLLSFPVSSIGGILRKRVSEKSTNPDEYLGFGLSTSAAYLGVVFLFLFFGWEAINSIVEALEAHYLLVLITLTISISIFQLMTKFFDGMGRPGASAWVEAGRWVAITIISVVFSYFDFTVLSVVYGYSIISIIFSIIVFIKLQVVPVLPSKETVWGGIDYGKWNLPSSILFYLGDNFPVFLLGIFFGGSSVGLYKAAHKIAEVGAYISTCIKDPLHVKVSSAFSQGDNYEDEFIRSVGYITFVGMFVLALSVGMPNDLLYVIYGPEFQNVSVALGILALSQLVYASKTPFTAILKAVNHPREVVKGQLGVFILTTPLAIWLTLEYGILGSAIGLLVFENMLFLVHAVSYKMTIGEVSFPLYRWGVQLFSAGSVYGVITLLSLFIDLSSISAVSIVVISMFVLYVSLNGLLNAEFRKGLWWFFSSIRHGV